MMVISIKAKPSSVHIYPDIVGSARLGALTAFFAIELVNERLGRLVGMTSSKSFTGE